MRRQLPQAGSDQKNEKMMCITGVIGTVPMAPFFYDQHTHQGSLSGP